MERRWEKNKSQIIFADLLLNIFFSADLLEDWAEAVSLIVEGTTGDSSGESSKLKLALRQ